MKEDHKGNGQDYNGQEVPIDETIGRSLGNESLDEDLCTLGAGAEPEGYSLSYSLSLKKFFVSTYVKNVVVKLHVFTFQECLKLVLE